ncbi:MAG: hypothetical protein Q4E60_04245 [Bacteroidales bacterium]|nr:hypothetical protein [Bacteroidales bacterium]
MDTISEYISIHFDLFDDWKNTQFTKEYRRNFSTKYTKQTPMQSVIGIQVLTVRKCFSG